MPPPIRSGTPLSHGRPAASPSWLGRRERRVEDPPLLRGAARFMDDLVPDGALHAAFVRSDVAHGRIRSVDVTAALATGALVFVAADLGPANGPARHPKWPPPPVPLIGPSGMRFQEATLELLASTTVRFVGEAVAVVLAADPYHAHDAARLVVAEIEPLEPVVGAARALQPGAPRLHESWPDNEAARFRLTTGSWAEAAAAADLVVAGEYRIGRAAASPMEPRGIVVIPGGPDQPLLVHSGNQIPGAFRDAVAVLTGLPRDGVIVRAPETGGGFGSRGMFYPEELAVALIAVRLGRPVKWISTRHEDLLAGAHARDQVHALEIALLRDGRILGVRDRFVTDAGACNALGITVPYNTATHLRGPYRIPVADIEAVVAITNRSPVAAYRGAGRPEAAFAMERALDRAARAIGMDPVQLRRVNLLREDELPLQAGIPYRDGMPLVMDIGAPGPCLEQALEILGFDGFRARQATARAAGRLLGLGVAAYVEGTGIGPAETAEVSIDAAGLVTVAIAPSSQGQGHRTAMAQIAADQLGVDPSAVTVLQGDTSLRVEGNGAVASRTLVVAGNAVADAASALRERLLAGAADLLEASPGDIALADGRVGVAGSGPSRTIGEVAAHLLVAEPRDGSGAKAPGGAGGPPALRASGRFAPATVTFAHGVQAAMVELDPLSGAVTILRYVVVHDAGVIVNPLIVDGQVAGGVAQGIGAALSERLRYGDDGQLLTATLADYHLPRSTDIPEIEMVHRETPSARNPMGVKGVGEAGIIAAPAAVINAVADALGEVGDALTGCPAGAEEIRRLIVASGFGSRQTGSTPR